MALKSCNLNDCFLCLHCLPEWKNAIAGHKKTISFKKGESMFNEGDKATGIYFLYTGSAKVYKKWNEPKELIVRFVKPGDILGYRGLIGDEPYPVSASVLEDSQACFVDISFWEASLKVNTNIAYKLMDLYGSDLHSAEMRMRNMVHMDVNARIAETLLHMQKFFGKNEDDFISVDLTRQEIAEYSGTTYETVFKFLKVLSLNKTISTSGKSIRINKPDRLVKIISNANKNN
jgi:CRP-like cAMP-binding protein